MITTSENRIAVHETAAHAFHTDEATTHRFAFWPVGWSAILVGGLASLAAIAVLGLAGVALGLHVVGVENRVVDLRTVGFATLAFSVLSAFLAYVLGGWVTGKVGGIYRSEPAMLHGAITWLATVPVLLVLGSLGAGSFFGGWHAGLSGAPRYDAVPFDRPMAIDASASQADRAQYAAARAEYDANVKKWREETPRATRNAALGAITALLLGLMGSVIGGWMASGEPMTLTYHRMRDGLTH